MKPQCRYLENTYGTGPGRRCGKPPIDAADEIELCLGHTVRVLQMVAKQRGSGTPEQRQQIAMLLSLINSDPPADEW